MLCRFHRWCSLRVKLGSMLVRFRRNVINDIPIVSELLSVVSTDVISWQSRGIGSSHCDIFIYGWLELLHIRDRFAKSQYHTSRLISTVSKNTST